MWLRICTQNVLLFCVLFNKVSLLDVNDDNGKKAIRQLENDHGAVSSRVLFIKCDVTKKNEFEGNCLSYNL